MEKDSLYQRIYHLVKQIPSGQVCSYGTLARQVGTTPRVVGFALAALAAGSAVPWQRVINSQGRVSPGRDSERGALQRQLLVAEGVVFDASDRVMAAHWHKFLF